MNADTRTARLAFVGLGNWGRNLARVVAEGDFATIEACFARTAERRDEFAREFGCRAIPDFDALLGDDDVDGLVVATPHSTHGEIVRAAAAAGKHVFVEKPLTLRVDDALSAVRAAEDAGTVLQVAHFRRRKAATRRLRALIDEGELGLLHLLEAKFFRPGGLTGIRGWRDDRSEAPAGGMTNLGVHMVDNLLYLGGPVSRVCAFSKQVYGGTELDDVTTIMLEFEAGHVGSVGTALVLSKQNSTAVHGTGGSAWSEEDGTRLFRQDIDADARVEETVEPVDPLVEQLREYARCVQTGERPETDGWAGLDVVRILEAVVRSAAENGAPVELEPIAGRPV